MLNPKIDALKEKANSLPPSPGVYLMKDKKSTIIYIGKAKVLKNRVSSYFRENAAHNEKVLKMVSQVDDFDYIITDSEFEALVLECSLIKLHMPKYNILLKDDKGYQYIKVSSEPYPKISAVKQKVGEGTFIGPYAGGFGISQAVDEANSAFMLYTCNKKFPRDFGKGKPCLNYHIKRCAGVCRGHISQTEYRELVSQAIEYIKNGSEPSVQKLQAQMERYAQALEFEKAAKVRDRIQAIARVSEKQKVLQSSGKDQDVIAVSQLYHTSCVVVIKYRQGRLVDKRDFFIENSLTNADLYSNFLTGFYGPDNQDIPKQVLLDTRFEDLEMVAEFISQTTGKKVSLLVPQRGEQKKMVELAQNNAFLLLNQKFQRTGKDTLVLSELAELLGLSSPPDYIEAYDVSNLGDTNIVCGMVVFQNGNSLKSAYKRFAIKQQTMQDDYGAMREAIERRFLRYLEQKQTGVGFGRLPDLILLDGGKGHVSAIQDVLTALGIDVPLFGMVKDERHRTRALVSAHGEIALKPNRAVFKLITHIQDEVHRYSVNFQSNRHKRTSFALELETIPGIGTKKAQALLRTFKTKKAVSQATIEQIMQTAKVNQQTAEKIKNLFL